MMFDRPADRLEFRVKLNGHEPGVIGNLDDLDQPPLSARTGELHPVGRELLAVYIVELVAMPMPLEMCSAP
jgi:hypothetical protein